MSTTTNAPLLDYLRHECEVLHAASGSVLAAAEEAVRPRVPLEVAGMLWSAEVAHVEAEFLQLVVDQQAIPASDDAVDAIIHFQPDNGPRHHTSGRLTHCMMMTGDKVRLNFELS
jgi:hypothetical protein